MSSTASNSSPVAHRKRARASSESEPSSPRVEKSASHAKKKQKKNKETTKVPKVDTVRKELTEELISAGRAICRSVSFTCNFQELVDCLCAEATGDTMPEVDESFPEVVARCKRVQPLLIDSVKKASKRCEMGIQDISDLLRKGQEAAQAADISSIKEKLSIVFQHVTFEPPIDPCRAKEGLGFNHPQCAELLRPFNGDWDDAAFQPGCLNGTYTPSSEDLPAFIVASIYDVDPTDDEQNILDRLFLSPSLFRAARIILFGPSKALKSPTKLSNKCNASKNNIRKASAELIAYITVIVRFCLSDEPTYSNNHFGYVALYDEVLGQLKAEDFATELRNILATWNREIFSQVDRTRGPPGTKKAYTGVEKGSDYLKRLKAERSAAIAVAKALPGTTAVRSNTDGQTTTQADQDAATALAGLARAPLSGMN